MNRIIVLLMTCNALVAVAAFLKDVIIASYAGTSAAADDFTFAYFIADTIGGNWLSASLAVAAVTIYAKTEASYGISGLRRIWRRSTAVFSLFAAMAAVCLALLGRMLPGNALLKSSLTLMSPIVLLLAIFATVTAYLQSRNRFVVPAAAPLLMHGFFIAAAAFAALSQLPVERGLLMIAGSVPAGALAMLLLALPYMREQRMRGQTYGNAEPDKPFRQEQVSQSMSEIWKIFGTYSLLAIGGQAILLWERALGATLGVGTVSAVNYAYRISQVPVWVVASAAASILLPKLSAMAAGGRLSDAKRFTGGLLQLVILAVLPVTLAIWLLSEPITAVLFYRGQFTWHSVTLTSSILSGYALSIVGYSLSAIFIRCWLAFGKAVQPAAIVLLCTAATIGLQWPLAQSFGPPGIAYGSAAGASLQAALLALPLLRRQIVSLHAQGMGKVFAAALCFTLVMAAGRSMWETFFIAPEELWRIVFLFLTLAAGFGLYAVIVRKTALSLAKGLSREW
ncbi:murein biosynthesis integral membrane protein MurJ [Paenibacillus thermotolerans]|uniref:murein biosynthesis integral membrane protein MurJ n=1 Tax=Paenibacillus thermotolerans TaxID=3027807 RepID=UPI0023681E5E|nr:MULTISPECIES: lipid II flippase MurJ [unclassified Paenibacillus]